MMTSAIGSVIVLSGGLFCIRMNPKRVGVDIPPPCERRPKM
jgi:hypothetical protein